MNNPRKGDWITTYSGKTFYPLDPHIEDIDVYDIIHALSNLCRFNGHCTSFYSIAQHSVLVSLMCHPEDQLWGLIHDAAESYLSDIPSPLKRTDEFAFYRETERNLMKLICDKFNLKHEEPESVKIADKRMLVTEARDLTFTEGRGWQKSYEPYDFTIKPWAPDYARTRFISRLNELWVR